MEKSPFNVWLFWFVIIISTGVGSPGLYAHSILLLVFWTQYWEADGPEMEMVARAAEGSRARAKRVARIVEVKEIGRAHV